MSSSFGKNIRVSIFGESHSKEIGVTVEGIKAGEHIDMGKIARTLERRAPGKNPYSSPRREPDEPIVLSGIKDGVTTGSPIKVIIENVDVRSEDYDKLQNRPRPSHADYSAYMKYGDSYDMRGGGQFSGRMTAPLCIAGSICMQILKRRGIVVGAHINSIGSVRDVRFGDIVNKMSLVNNVSLIGEIKDKDFSVIDDDVANEMIDVIMGAKNCGDSVGGTVECCIVGLPAGVGEPIFDGIENRISQVVFGIPAVKGIEFGSGFAGSEMFGSENNDEFYLGKNDESDLGNCDESNKRVRTKTNNSGGILGGISNGMPIIFNTAFKPTPSISKKQQTVDLATGEEVMIEVEGRHDPCIVPRAVPCVESAAAIAILDLLVESEVELR